MKRRKFLLGGSALLASGSLLVSTRSASSVTADRNVQVEIVGDRDAYLGLKEDEDMDEDAVLFGTDMPRESPEKFDIDNQSAGPVDMDVELLNGNLRFTDETSEKKEERETGVDISDDGSLLEIKRLGAGERVSDVTVANPTTTTESDTLSFDVTGTDDGLQIEAERDLELQPAEESENFTLCRGNKGQDGSGNSTTCRDVDVSVTDLIDEFFVKVTYEHDSGTATKSDNFPDPGELTIKLEKLRSGNWRVTSEGGGPGEPVTKTIFDGRVIVMITPDGQGSEKPTMTVSTNEA